MAPKKIGDYKLKNIVDAFETEAQALSKIHITVSNQLNRLQLEEQLLEQMLQKAQQQQQPTTTGSPAQQMQQAAEEVDYDEDYEGHEQHPSDDASEGS